jgi:3-hydroxybutyryl-CoA dehydrogenase
MDQAVVVIGGGVMGSGIAQLAAMAGGRVRLVDVDDSRLSGAMAGIDKSLGRFVKSGRLTEVEAGDVVRRITMGTSIAEAVQDADVVVEAVLERLGVKHAVFTEVVEHAPDHTILGTNTSQLSITSIASGVGSAASRVIGMHFFNPPVMMRLLELVRGLETCDETLERAKEFGDALGKEVVVCQKDSPGFLTSRISAILRVEALRMLEEGLATAEDIDRAIKLAFNHPMGPLELGDFNGLDTYLDALTGLREAHGERFAAPVLLKNMVAAGRLGRKSGSGFYSYSD